ncbi:VOC family protein [Kordiimonas marina]|uniref:VOC family protein n=1 Tax=Kordiimonas marina TaxID=2872312 RepID=UPI001FF4D89E|nr:VOC family protein [Kordiimonas marina]MCJ9428300.1 VOC family protein [Kordiimonas marina]
MDLNQVTLGATDLDASIAFYRTLGLRLIVHSNDHYARFELPNGKATFSLHKVEGDSTNTGTGLVYFEVPDVDAEVKRLEAEGIRFEAQPTDQRWLWREAYLRDPAGNRLCLYHAGENRRYPPWRLKD